MAVPADEEEGARTPRGVKRSDAPVAKSRSKPSGSWPPKTAPASSDGATIASITRQWGRQLMEMGEHPFAGVPSWALLVITVVVCVAGSCMGLRRRRRRKSEWGLDREQLAQIGRASRLLSPAINAALEARRSRRLDVKSIERALGFLAGEYVRCQRSSPDIMHEVAMKDGATVPSRRLVQELEFFVDFASAAGHPAAEVRTRMGARGFTLLLHNPATPGGAAAHYIAFNSSRRLCVLAIRSEDDEGEGTAATVGEALSPPVPFMLDDRHATGVSARRSAAVAALQLLAELRTTLTELFADYTVTVVGHSAGGACAALVAWLLRQECGLLSVKAMCYGPPPVLSRASALACKAYVTSVVLRADGVPRSSGRSLRVAAGLVEGVNSTIRTSGEAKARRQIVDILKGASTKEGIDKDLLVAGTVVLVYEGSIGATTAAQLDGTMSCLQSIEMAPSFIADHGRQGYAAALEKLLARLPPDDPSWQWCGSMPPSRSLSPVGESSVIRPDYFA
eukprot:TRINITY_DN3755_c5_g1_i1.p1 TRINITY_DN3755_c5_g1~~TRINITY_DN3755_c5_g1_i1.p1  ORF type:complete len:508 (+),score=158.25 TRINITY_DN3755_c5_g1_i1:176-1699(+)